MKRRLYSEVRKITFLLLLGVAYYLLITNMKIRIPCVFNLTTGLLCPACGITRMFIAMLRFDLVAAYAYNKLLFLTWPIILFILVYQEYNYVRYGKRALAPFNFLAWTEIVLLVLFGILRNIL